MTYQMLTIIAMGALLSSSEAMRAGMEHRVRANPIRRVVNMLEKMQKSIAAEGAKAEELHKKFMCYCEGGDEQLKATIADEEKKIPQLQSSVEEGKAEELKLTADLKEAKTNLAAANEALTSGAAMRHKESINFAKESASYKTNIEGLAKAITALRHGAGAGFLQTRAANVVRRLAVDMENMSPQDRDTLSTFLSMSSSQAQKYEPQGGEIIGICTQMSANMEHELIDMTKLEDTRIAEFADMERAKASEIMSLKKAIESKTQRKGELKVELSELNIQLEDTKASYADDTKFLADLDKNCESKKRDWEVRQKMQSAELLALSDTIKILTEDSALDMFKKTLPSPTTMSFVQIQMPESQLRGDAARALKTVGGDPRLKLLAMQLQNKQHFSFKKVLVMIEEMLKLCGQEQKADDEKLSSCNSNIADGDALEHHLKDDIDDINADLDAKKSKLDELTDEIHTLAKKIKQSDAMVADATKLRKADHAEFQATQADDAVAKDLLAVAKNRLNKFYAPSKYKDTQDQPVQASLGLAQQSADPGAPPQAAGEYKKMGDANQGVMLMLSSLIADMAKDMQQNEAEETAAQTEYEQTLKDAAETRRQDYNRLEEARGEKAGTEARIHKANRRHTETSEELGTVRARLHTLHDSCDWLIANYELRKVARASEVEALQRSRSILSGAGAE